MEVVCSNGRISNHYVYASHGIRPSVSLATGTRSMDGDGYPVDPFAVRRKIKSYFKEK